MCNFRVGPFYHVSPAFKPDFEGVLSTLRRWFLDGVQSRRASGVIEKYQSPKQSRNEPETEIYRQEETSEPQCVPLRCFQHCEKKR